MIRHLLSAIWLIFELLLITVVTLVLTGCDETPSASEIRQNLQVSRESSTLFRTITFAMNDLDQSVDTNVRRRRLRLDRDRSTDGQPVMAIIRDDPHQEGIQFTILYVPLGNSGFIVDVKDPKVAAGDIVHFFGKIEGYNTSKKSDKGDQEMLGQFGNKTYYELKVKEVINENELRLVEGLEVQVPDLKKLPKNHSFKFGPEALVIYRESDEKLLNIKQRLNTWISKNEPKIDWEPTPDEKGVGQLVDRLNQWIETQQKPESFENEMLQQLKRFPKPIQQLPAYQDIDKLKFRFTDGRFIQEAIWLRDIARRAQHKVTPLEQSKFLFDWVVRNIQLQTPRQVQSRRQRPWHTLLFGRGTAEDRAWVFSLLARQLYLEVVTLYPTFSESSQQIRYPISALVHDGQLYLFDLTLGLAIPGPDGSSVATLRQVMLDDGLLRQLDVSTDFYYPLKKDDFKSVTASIESTPQYLSTKMRMLQLQLVGEERVVLYADVHLLSEKLDKIEFPSGKKLRPGFSFISGLTMLNQMDLNQAQRATWANEFMVFNRFPRLWKARVLDFKNNYYRTEFDHLGNVHKVYDTEYDAMSSYRRSRYRDDYLNRTRTPWPSLAKFYANRWMGLHFAQQNDYPVAYDFLQTRMMQNPLWPAAVDYLPGSLIFDSHNSVAYNLARTHESQAEYYRHLTATMSVSGTLTTGNAALTIVHRATTAAIQAAEKKHRWEAIALYERTYEREQHTKYQQKSLRLQKIYRAMLAPATSEMLQFYQSIIRKSVYSQEQRNAKFAIHYHRVLKQVSPQLMGNFLRARRLRMIDDFSSRRAGDVSHPNHN